MRDVEIWKKKLLKIKVFKKVRCEKIIEKDMKEKDFKRAKCKKMILRQVDMETKRHYKQKRLQKEY